MFHVLHAAFLAALRFLRFYGILETPTAGEYRTTSALLARGSFSPEDVPPTIPGLPQSTIWSGDCVAADGTGKPRAKVSWHGENTGAKHEVSEVSDESG